MHLVKSVQQHHTYLLCHQSFKMSAAAENQADNQAPTTTEATNGTAPAPAQATDAAAVSADEGRRLYIGNLAYATTEGELKEFFKNYKM